MRRALLATRSPLSLLLLFSLSVACSAPAEETPDQGTPSPAEEMGVVEDMTAAEEMSVSEDMAQDLGGVQDLATPDLDLADMSDAGQEDMAPDATMEDMAAMVDMTLEPDMADMGEYQYPMMPDGMPLMGFGTLSGNCQQLDVELDLPYPALYRNTLDFMMDAYDMGDLMKLTAGGQVLMTTDNAGGASTVSEAFAFEVLARCEGATLIKTETQIGYEPPSSKKTDILVEIDGKKVGVSVVRAFAFPFDQPYPESEARRILEKKLGDIPISSANVKPEDAWVKQILSVIAFSSQHADQIEAVYYTLDPALRGDTILYLTVTDGADDPIYFQGN